MHPEHLIETINEDHDSSIHDESPECYTPNGDPTPLCKGELNSGKFAESDCFTCCLYENYVGDKEGYY